MSKRLKIAFISGPANVREIYREWSEQTEQVYFGTDYMKQFLQVVRDVNGEAFVVTWHGNKRETFQLGEFTFDNRPITEAGGARYYLEHLIWHMKVLVRLIAYRPDVLLLTGNQNFWWLLSPLRLFGTKIIVSYHAVVWQKLSKPTWVWRLMVKLNGLLILKHAKAILSTSNDIRRQVEEVLGSSVKQVEILDHLPTYSPQQFAGIRPPSSPTMRPFRTFFLGRNETNKGIFDIVEIGRQLEQREPGMYKFDLCGSGSQLESLRKRVAELGLHDVVRVHGYSSPEHVRQLLNESHACIVPTRSDYEAGFEMTCSESILAGRPLVTSPVCPALEHLADASVEVAPDEVDAYRDAIVALANDPDLYERKREACEPLQAQFYDRGNSWYSAMMAALKRYVLPGSPVDRGATPAIAAEASG